MDSNVEVAIEERGQRIYNSNLSVKQTGRRLLESCARERE
jgi:hypothetical protein